MRSLSAPVIAAISSGRVGVSTLVKFAFPSGIIALNSSTMNLVYAGDTYLAAFGLGQINPVNDAPGALPGIQMELTRVDPTFVALALDDADQVQGTPVTIMTAIVDAETYTVLDVQVDWTGYCDTMALSEDGGTASIQVTAESKGVDLLRGNPLTYSDGDQQSISAGDRYFEYVVSQTDKPVVWPTKAFFTK